MNAYDRSHPADHRAAPPDLMRVRITANGPEAWRMAITDADTGRLLPVLLDDSEPIRISVRDGMIVAELPVVVSEMDIIAETE